MGLGFIARSLQTGGEHFACRGYFSNTGATNVHGIVKLARGGARPTLSAKFCVAAMLISSAVHAQTGPDAAGTNSLRVVTRGQMTKYPNGVTHVAPSAFGVTSDIRDLPRLDPNAEAMLASFKPKEANPFNRKVIKPVIPGAGIAARDFQDPLVANAARGPNAPQAMPLPGLTFNGATSADNTAQGVGSLSPPDVNGDVGLNHYVSSVNLVYKIFNKDGTVAAGPFKTNALFAGLPATDPCRTRNDGDPVVVYDSLADRWHISQFAIPGFIAGGGSNYQCVAVSVTGDPTGSYYVWSYPYPGNVLNDYPKVGVWSDAYHMTFNQFDNVAPNNFAGFGILSQDRIKALAGDPTASVVYTNVATIDPNAGGALPADIDGFVAPPVGMAVVIGEMRSATFGDPLDAIRFYKWAPNFTSPGSSTITVLPDTALAAFDPRNPNTRLQIEQSGGANLDAIGDRLMHRLAYRNLGTQAAPVNSFVGNFTVNVSGVNPTTAGTYQTGVRWFEMRRTGDAFTVFDQGTHNLTPGNGATGNNNWMGSMAQDNQGNLALGFSQASTTQRANIMIAGRTNNVTNSGTLNEGEAVFFAAAGSQSSTGGRWGDYSAMNIDPVDDCTFWYTQEYYAATSTTGWSTRVGRFVFPTCTPAPKATIQGTITNCATAAPVDLASVAATGGYGRVTGATGTYTMTVAPGTYTVTGSKPAQGYSTASQSGVVVTNGGTATVNLCLAPTAILNATTAVLVSESFLPANGAIDPGETVTIALGVQNVGGISTVSDVGTLQATGGVTSPSAAQNYGVVVNAGPAVSRNFTFTASPALSCGDNVTATVAHQDGATNLGSFAYALPTGAPGGTTTTSYTGPPVAIPDNAAAGVNIPLVVSGVVGPVSDVNFRLDSLAGCSNSAANANASVTHTFPGDLRFKLTSPGGTTVSLIANRGGSGDNFCTITLDDDGGFPAASTIVTTGGVAGNFAPESPLSAFDGQNANGTWILNVADTASVDTGTLNRFSLIITGRTCSLPPPPDLTIAKTHTGNFSQGQVGATYSTIVTNSGTGAKPAGTPVSVTDAPPSGLTILAMSGTGWTCTTLPTCTRSDVLAAGASYPPITITVAVAGAAASPQVNSIAVATAAAESNTGNNTATDSTTIVSGVPGLLTVTKAGSGTGTVASLDGGINCGASCSQPYVLGSNILLTATPAGAAVFTGWLGACTGAGSCAVPINGTKTVKATFAASSPGARILDIDANNQYGAATDGILIVRYLFGWTGTALTADALGVGATRSGSPQLPTYLLDVMPYFDVDGNGRAEPLTDGVMIVRKLLGLTGTAITNGALGTGATRDPSQIEAYIQTLTPP